MIQKLDMQTPNKVDENIEKLRELFPHAVSENKIDFDLLRQILSDSLVEGDEERYRLDWVGKKASLLKANSSINKTLRPCVNESVDFDNTQNLYIEGDNFEVLKLLSESYLNKIKMIYIDPPYNTGKDFVYRDNFTQSKADFEDEIGLRDEEGNKLFKNTDSNGRFHSDWLSMMYERLLVARDLLKEDGVIFISIDDNEVHNLRKICDEVFGEGNFRGDIIRATGTTTGQEAKKVGSSYDYMLCYSKYEAFKLGGLPLVGKDLNRFNNNDNDGKGKYALLQLRKTGNADRKEDRENMFFPILAPDNTEVYPIGPTDYLSRWRVGKKSYENFLKDSLIVWKMNDFNEQQEDNDEEFEEEINDSENNEKSLVTLDILEYKSNWKPYVKYYLSGRTKQVSNLWIDIDGNKKGSIELREILEKKVFDNPKPLGFLSRVISISCEKNDLVLDFFSGSATTAHAVMQLNAEDGGNRKFIMVQLPESTDEKSEAYKAGYKNICEIGKERIRRAGAKITQEIASAKPRNDEIKIASAKPRNDGDGFFVTANDSEAVSLDIGFRVLKIDSTNFKDVYYHPNNLTQKDIFDFQTNIKEERTDLDLLFQIMLDLGIELSLKITPQTVDGTKIYMLENNELIACLEDNISLLVIEEIKKLKPYQVVLKDGCFKDDNDKINAVQELSSVTTVSVL